MTILQVFQSSTIPPEEMMLLFQTSDDYPHMGDFDTYLQIEDRTIQTPFHVLRMGQPNDPDEHLMFVFKFGLSWFKFSYSTKAPDIISHEYRVVTIDGLEAALIDFDYASIVSTIVVPEGI